MVQKNVVAAAGILDREDNTFLVLVRHRIQRMEGPIGIDGLYSSAHVLFLPLRMAPTPFS